MNCGALRDLNAATLRLFMHTNVHAKEGLVAHAYGLHTAAWTYSFNCCAIGYRVAPVTRVPCNSASFPSLRPMYGTVFAACIGILLVTLLTCCNRLLKRSRRPSAVLPLSLALAAYPSTPPTLLVSPPF